MWRCRVPARGEGETEEAKGNGADVRGGVSEAEGEEFVCGSGQA